jgi:hypothetical protein
MQPISAHAADGSTGDKRVELPRDKLWRVVDEEMTDAVEEELPRESSLS